MTFLLSSYRELVLAKTLLRKDKERILTQQRVELRLAQVFSKLEKIKSENKSFFLTFDNGLDSDPAFRGVIEGTLYIDKEKRLTLATWPQENSKDKPRVEVLMENIDDFKLRFLDTGLAGFVEDYPKEKPSMMKVFLESNNNTTTLPLIL